MISENPALLEVFLPPVVANFFSLLNVLYRRWRGVVGNCHISKIYIMNAPLVISVCLFFYFLCGF